MTVERALADRRLVVVLGPGGVGKTTASALLALRLARRRRTLVFTADPARRLADALGVPLARTPVRVRENLHACMLDPKASLDALVSTYARPRERDAIFASPLYAHLSDAFAGSEDFVAMGDLYEHVESGDFETIVVDTPPSRHAVDFLDVPSRLLRVFETGAVRWVLRPGGFLAGGAASLLATATSGEYARDLAGFFAAFGRMFEELEARARRMQTLLGDPASTATILVAAPEAAAVRSAAALATRLAERGAPPAAVIVNRVLPPIDLPGPSVPAGFGDLAPRVERAARLYEALRAEEAPHAAAALALAPAGARVAARAGGLRTLARLEEAAREL
ncbi:MAG TPA: ArsA-related P-loop ATPase [Candidatus Thermoplasmatota archaeon]|nr:ArsA-related P-loop ATPase [Candidatus Thermoplasmatota archaeon]